MNARPMFGVLEPRVFLTTVSGTVYADTVVANNQPDPGEGVAGCVVTFNRNSDHLVATPVTADDGTFAVEMQPGDYSVNVDGPGIKVPVNLAHFVVPADGSATLVSKVQVEGGPVAGPPPDLSITVSPVPVTFKPTTKPVTVTIVNNGGAYNGPLTVAAYFSADKVIDAGDVALPQVKIDNVSIGAKRRQVIPLDVASALGGLPGGSYFVLANVTATGDANTANNTAASRTATKVVTPSVELTGTLKVSKPTKTKALRFALSIRNAGTVTATGPVTVALAARPVAGGADVPLASPAAVAMTIKSRGSAVYPKASSLVSVAALPAGSYRLVATFSMATTPAEGQTGDNTVAGGVFTVT